ncbi:hypothetical protein EVAR_52797_1 [Eumeta japonica]|uniref:Uncharacterized protein n=1 Tax=Eumeta variegata TaxID=151549 RepID=A0A4C1Y3I4_EUMVA|nr:hypothetical protein EVAR_52797_1 [Eumeta japonica]
MSRKEQTLSFFAILLMVKQHLEWVTDEQPQEVWRAAAVLSLCPAHAHGYERRVPFDAIPYTIKLKMINFQLYPQLTMIRRSSRKYPISFLKADNELVTPLRLRESMAGGDHILSDGSHSRLPLRKSCKKVTTKGTYHNKNS